ncbi:MAG TPA: ERF family protein [Rugosibacter sp.]|nr:ERF family protein [Rugosibacter sp.]
MTEEKNTLIHALVRFQAGMRDIEKSASGYGYKYAPLHEVWAAIRAPLADNGLAIIQHVVSNEAGCVGVKTILAHTSGGREESTVYADHRQSQGKMSQIQAAGSVVTYLRRYALSAMLGLTSDEDVDGHAEQTKPAGKPPKPASKKPKPPAPDPDLEAAGLGGDGIGEPPKASPKAIKQWYGQAVAKYGSHEEAMRWMIEITGKEKSCDLDCEDIINLNEALKEE